jgi:amino acid transporter
MLIRTVDFTTFAFTSDWKPIGHTITESSPLRLSGVSDDGFGISGPGGTLFAFM